MVPMIGFDHGEERSIHGLLERFRGDGFFLGGLDHIEKKPMPGYDGKVIPRRDWGNALVSYALLLGLLHGAGRRELDPLKMIPRRDPLPVRALKGMADFRRRSEGFFDAQLALAPQDGFGVIQPMTAPTAS